MTQAAAAETVVEMAEAATVAVEMAKAAEETAEAMDRVVTVQANQLEAMA